MALGAGDGTKRLAYASAALMLAGCDLQPAKVAEPREVVEAARFVLVPASKNPIVASGTSYLFAWRLDTKSGEVSVCTYDPGGWINAATKLPAPESVSCSAPAN
jgi:hypothetical protein